MLPAYIHKENTVFHMQQYIGSDRFSSCLFSSDLFIEEVVSFLFSFPSSTSVLKLAWFQAQVYFILYIETRWVDIVLPQRLFLIFLKQWAILPLGNLFSCFAFLLLYFCSGFEGIVCILLWNYFIAFDEVGERMGGNERASDQDAWLTAYKLRTFFWLMWFWLENNGLLLLFTDLMKYL